MTTLTQPGLSSLIDRLFAEADAAEHSRWPAAADDRGDYRQYYGQLKDQPLPVSRATGGLRRQETGLRHMADTAHRRTSDNVIRPSLDARSNPHASDFLPLQILRS
jgi:hypothetical protein